MVNKDFVFEMAFAKINLHLDITGRLEGGYHAVSTVMQTVSVCDEITISNIKEIEGDSRFTLGCNVPGVPTDEKNIAIRAALMFCERVGVNLSAHIYIEKNIPMAAGMAGGSADGAAVLRGLNRALSTPLDIGELCVLGSRLGADVPFCIVGGTMYADGKGDILHSIPGMPDCTILAACEGEGVSTPWAYGLLDSVYAGFEDSSVYTPKDTSMLLDALAKKDIIAVAESMYNVFEAPVLGERPVAAHVKELMLEGGAVGAMMSGSGPSVFGIFRSLTMAETAGRRLEKEGYKAYVCKPV